MTIKTKIINLSLLSLKLGVGFASSIALLFGQTTSASASAAASVNQAADAQRVGELVQSIQSNAAGGINAANISIALEQSMGQFPETNVEQWAHAINRLDLSGNALEMAINTTAGSFGVDVADIVSGMVVDTYMTNGAGSAREQVFELRASLGDEVLNNALDTTLNASGNDDVDSTSTQDAMYNG